LDALALHVGLEIPRIEEVVLDGVAGAGDVGILEATDRTDDLHLHVERQAGGDPVRVEFVGGQAFRLDEDLVRRLVGKAGDLVLDRRAVARAIPSITPAYMGLRSRLLRITSWVCSLVWVT
jgi:hypothetical protein